MSRRALLNRLALVAAGAYALTGALELSHDQAAVFVDPIDYAIEIAFVLALAASVGVFFSIGRARLSGRTATVGWMLALAGNTALATAALATTIEGREALAPLFALGFLAIVAGYLALAAVDLRGRLVPPRAGLLLLLGFSATAVVANLVTAGGSLVLAATWAALSRLICAPDVTSAAGRRTTAAGASL